MLSDRHYMRGDAARRPVSVLTWFLGLLVGVFVVQKLLVVFLNYPEYLQHVALSGQGIREGRVWTLLSYAFLHSTDNLAHLLLNGLGLYTIGRQVEQEIGPTRFVQLLLATTLGAGLIWLGVHYQRPGTVIGASGIVMGLLAVFACSHPQRPTRFLLFFIIPVTIQPIWLVAAIGGIDLIGFILRELPDKGTLYGIAHSAHLGGLVAGWLFHRLVLSRPIFNWGDDAAPPASQRRPAVRTKASYAAGPSPNATPATSSPVVPPTSRNAIRVEVDRILDKINLHGFASLTDAEKRVLDQARHLLNHR